MASSSPAAELANGGDAATDDFLSADPEQREVLDEEPRSIIRAIISQLTRGTDLHRVSLPTFVLEPRSMLERITDFMSHPDLIMKTHLKPDPVDRFVDVVRYFISGWHIRPRGVKKPYNPVLGEFFRCRYEYTDGSKAIFVAEQTSHHPPISTYYFDSPENHLVIRGELKPKSRFLGNSAATLMNGETRLLFTNLNEEYVLNLPNVYARGLLFGTMILELGDTVKIRCQKNGLTCDLDFKTKGYFSGTYNAISGKIRRDAKKETLYDISGKWSDITFIKKSKSWGSGSSEAVEFFNVGTSTIHPKVVVADDEQEHYESRRLWSQVTAAILARNLDKATEEKEKVEEAQRELRRKRTEEKIKCSPRFFERVGSAAQPTRKNSTTSATSPSAAQSQQSFSKLSGSSEGSSADNIATSSSNPTLSQLQDGDSSFTFKIFNEKLPVDPVTRMQKLEELIFSSEKSESETSFVSAENNVDETI